MSHGETDVRPVTRMPGAGILRPIALEIRHLRLVLAIEEERGITRAGEKLHLTQSALSHQLKEIETRLGVPLFLRIKKRLVITEAGKRVVAVARQTLAAVVELEEELRGAATGRRGVLRLTTECYTCYDWLPTLLKRFGQRYPDVEVRIDVDATRRPLAALREGSVDLALVTCPVDERELVARPLFEDELFLVTAPDHPLARRRFVRPVDLASERLLGYSPPQESRFYQQFMAASGVAPREVVQVQLTEAMMSMVRAGLGVAAVAGWAIDRELRRGTLAAVRLGQRGLQRTWQAATLRVGKPPAYVAYFSDLISAHAAPARHERRQAAG